MFIIGQSIRLQYMDQNAAPNGGLYYDFPPDNRNTSYNTSLSTRHYDLVYRRIINFNNICAVWKVAKLLTQMVSSRKGLNENKEVPFVLITLYILLDNFCVVTTRVMFIIGQSIRLQYMDQNAAPNAAFYYELPVCIITKTLVLTTSLLRPDHYDLVYRSRNVNLRCDSPSN
ncbi:hypothetical protein COOONC_21216 [Cooperia oncophora]